MLMSLADCLIGGLASPAEAALFLLLTCPPAYGGFGLPKPEANPSIRLNETAKDLLPHQLYVKPDLFWREAKLDLEYDSSEYHKDTLTVHERHRIAALMAMGIDVLPVTRKMLYSPVALHGLANTVASKLGVPFLEPLLDRQAELRKTVLGSHDFW